MGWNDREPYFSQILSYQVEYEISYLQALNQVAENLLEQAEDDAS